MKSLALGLLFLGLTAATIGTTDIGEYVKTHHGKNVVRDEGTLDRVTKKVTPVASKFKVEVDEEEIIDIIDDFDKFGREYLTTTKAERMALLQMLSKAFRNTAAKMILNFGKTIPPVVHSWAQVMKHLQVNDQCDQTCAVKCLDPKASYETLYFNPTCLSSCRCRFDIEDLEPTVLRAKMDNVTRNFESVNRFFREVGVENVKLVKPSFDEYMRKAEGLHAEFGALLKEHAAKVLGCEETCLEDCVNPLFVSFWEIPACVKSCKCENGLIRIEPISKEYGVI